MTRKIIGYYNDAQDSSDLDQLILEIGSDQVACILKGAASHQVEGLELFALEKGAYDWSDIFYEVMSASKILGRSYRDVHCYYNFEEAIIIPEEKFSATAADDYLALVYGESIRHDIKYDTLLSPGHINAYRIRKSIHELVGRHFILYKPHHSYSPILDDILTRDQLDANFVKIQFYSNHIILAFVKDKQLQLIQSFRYETMDDVLYYLLRITHQFGIKNDQSSLEISGMFDTVSVLYPQLSKLFGLISFDTIQADGLFPSALADHPAHYFTPFYKLAV